MVSMQDIVAYKNIGEDGMKKLAHASVAIVGLGGLGSASARILAEMGVSSFTLYDEDTVDVTNLYRQTLYIEADIGKKKADIAKREILKINPKAKMDVRCERAREDNLNICSDILLDCTDNMESRFMLNRYCHLASVPWVFCSVSGSYGFTKLITKDTACLECFYSKNNSGEAAERGVLNTAVYLASSIQTSLAVKHLLGIKMPDELLSFDSWFHSIKRIKLAKDKRCGVCRR